MKWKRISATFIVAATLSVSTLLIAQPARAQDLKQKFAAAKQAAAKSQQALRAYSWIEKTELSLKGEVKSTKVESCRYGPDGKVQKTPVVEPPPQEKKRGLRGKMIEKKTGEMKAELEASAALVHNYIPPDPDKIQAVMNAGTASLSQAGPGAVALKFPGYVKAGDSLTLVFDSEAKSMRQIAVATWLDSPSDAVTFEVTMQLLPDGTSCPATIVLSIPSSKVEVRITKSSYQKLAQ
jgi:hypothetical protein